MLAFLTFFALARPAFDTCFSPDENCDKQFIVFLSSAEVKMDIAIYSITLPSISNAIIKAKKRGVRVRVLVDKQESQGPNSMVPVLQKNVEVGVADTDGIMHNKFTIIDSEALETGSFNYTLNASERNAENQLYLTEPSVIIKYSDQFEMLWKKAEKL